MADYSYIGSGKVYLREIGAASGLIEVGNCSALSFAVTEETKELKDYTNAGGGTYNEVRRISAVEMSMTMHDLSAENLARVLYGAATDVASGAVPDEEHTGYKGALLPVNNIASAVTSVEAKEGASAATRANTTPYALNAYVVPATPNGFYYKATANGTSGGSIPTYPTTVGATVVDGTVTWTCMGKVILVADTDYTVVPGGVLIAAGADMTDGEVMMITYTKASADAVEALVNSGKEYEMVFAGLNEARSGKETMVTAHRVKVGAAQNIGLIGDDYAALEVSGKLLKDTTKNGTSVSQYFRVAIEQ
jgi:hypothetical protein